MSPIQHTTYPQRTPSLRLQRAFQTQLWKVWSDLTFQRTQWELRFLQIWRTGCTIHKYARIAKLCPQVYQWNSTDFNGVTPANMGTSSFRLSVMWWKVCKSLEISQRFHSHINYVSKKLKPQYLKLGTMRYFYPLILLSSQKICCPVFEFLLQYFSVHFHGRIKLPEARSPSLSHQHCSLVADT